MTISPCVPLEDLERVAALPAGDPRRQHVATCPRCRALLDELALFHDPGAAADAPHVAQADARLSAFLAREIGVAPAEPPPVAAPARPAPARGRGGSWLEALLSPAVLRPALALGAVAVMLAGGLVLWPRLSGRAPDALRGAGGRSAAALAIREARLDAAGLRVTWNAVSAADAYEVRVYSSALAEIARLNANGDTAFAASPSDVPFRAVPGQALLVRVVARAGGDPVATSAPFPLAVAPSP